jgi:hypothetical protein
MKQGSNFIAAIAVEWEQNAMDHCGNDSNFLPHSAIFILFTVHYYFDTWIQTLIKSCVNYYFSLSFLRKKTLKKYVNMFLASQQSKVTIKLNFYHSNLKNAAETVKIAADSCYVLRQFLTPLPSIDFRDIRGLVWKLWKRMKLPKNTRRTSTFWASLRKVFARNVEVLLVFFR